MRNITENTEGIDKIMLATAAIALLLPAIYMRVVAPPQQPLTNVASQISITPHVEPATPGYSSNVSQAGVQPSSPKQAKFGPDVALKPLEVTHADLGSAG